MSSLKCSDHKKLGKLICATDFKSLIWHRNVQVENLNFLHFAVCLPISLRESFAKR